MDWSGLLSLPPEQTEEVLEQLEGRDLIIAQWWFAWVATIAENRPNYKQLAPEDDDWLIWFIMSGRGFGKTLACGYWAILEALIDDGPVHENITHVIAATNEDHEKTTFYGPTGLVNICPPELIVHNTHSPHYMELDNGAQFLSFTAMEPERLRGPQCKRGWCEEIGSWRYDMETWNMFMLGLRLGRRPRVAVSSTPKPRPLVKELTKHNKVRMVYGSTYENKQNLAEPFLEELLKYEGTRLGRQEIYGELLDLEELGIIPRSSIRLWPSGKPLPEFTFILMSLDTAFTEKTVDLDTFERDPTGCEVWGVFIEETVKTQLGVHVEQKSIYSAMLIDAWTDLLGFPDLVARVKKERLKRYGAPTQTQIHPQFGPVNLRTDGKRCDLILIEDIGSGKSLRQQLEVDGIQAYPYNPGRADKLARLHVVSPLFVRGRVWMLESPRVAKGDAKAGTLISWAEPVVEQLCSYVGEGSIAHDEYVDTCTQALRVLMDFELLRAVDKGSVLAEINRTAENKVRGFTSNSDEEYNPNPSDGSSVEVGGFVNPYTR